MIRIGKKKYNRIGKQENNKENKDGERLHIIHMTQLCILEPETEQMVNGVDASHTILTMFTTHTLGPLYTISMSDPPVYGGDL